MRRLLTLTAVASVFGLAGCFNADSDLERAVVGGAVGCAAGEVLADGKQGHAQQKKSGFFPVDIFLRSKVTTH